MHIKSENRIRRHRRIRTRITGTADRPRLSVYRSNTALYAQLIDDVTGMTLASQSTRNQSGKGRRERAHELGRAIAKAAGAQKITAVVFDRGGFLYAGSIRAVADGAREGGLKF